MVNATALTWISNLPLILALMTTGQQPTQRGGQPISINDRPTSASATISGSRRLYDGSYTLSARSRVCGETPKEQSFTGVATFVIEFPEDLPTNAKITSISFGSKQLVGGVTTTRSFTFSINVVTEAGGKPPAFVINTETPNRGTGTATLSKKNNETTLHVVGQNDQGANIDVTVTCS